MGDRLCSIMNDEYAQQQGEIWLDVYQCILLLLVALVRSQKLIYLTDTEALKLLHLVILTEMLKSYPIFVKEKHPNDYGDKFSINVLRQALFN